MPRVWGLVSRRNSRREPSYRSRWARDIGTARVAVRGPVEHQVACIEGEVDVAVVDDVVAALASIRGPVAAIDLSALEFIDVQSVQRLRAAARAMGMRSSREAPVPIQGASRAVRRTIELVDRRSAGASPRSAGADRLPIG